MGFNIQVADRVGSLFNLDLVAIVNAGLDVLLFAHNVNFLTELAVASLQIIELGKSFFELILFQRNFCVILFHLLAGWPVGLEAVLLLF